MGTPALVGQLIPESVKIHRLRRLEEGLRHDRSPMFRCRALMHGLGSNLLNLCNLRIFIFGSGLIPHIRTSNYIRTTQSHKGR
jgi:hypothetical protein